jgi:mono/diheme cytochrome c family protein
LRVVIVLFRAKFFSAKLCNSLRNVIALLIGFGGGYLIQFSNVSAQELIDFNTQIRPILSSNCFACHGPDESERAADLRLDHAEGAIRDLGGYSAIVPGNAEASELMKRVVSEDEDLHMPPLGKGASLTESQVLLLRSWIEQGANYSVHWAYVPPAEPRIPSVTHPEWVKNKIDYFILRSIEDAKLEPSPLADRLTLARRLSIDLTGLPPTWDEAVSFRDDSSPEAYEKFVDFLLDKPSFGERWARVWLDLSRYADSAGYADDPERTIWAFRDYVIRSLNANKSFDQFTIEQIAGDLLPNPTTDQLIATAFHRNTLTNNEGGTNDEEFRNVAVVDRVNTTMAVWMGTTMACAQCHTHKYDPITQKEYFELFAFFNNSRDADRRDEQPLHEVWNEEQLQQKKTVGE